LDRDIHLAGSTPHFIAPARYGSGYGFPFGTSFAVTYPAGGIGMEHFFRALGAYMFDAGMGTGHDRYVYYLIKMLKIGKVMTDNIPEVTIVQR
jgi:hypothetical protein